MNSTSVNRLPDRQSTGHQLSQKLQQYCNHPQAIVLGIPHDGPPLADDIARALNLPLDICLVRKVSLPDHPAVTIGAIAANSSMVLNYDVINSVGMTKAAVNRITATAWQELQQWNHCYRDDRRPPNLKDKILILVDDGIETSASVQAAIAQLSVHRPAQVILAAPMISPESCTHLRALVDEFVDLTAPDSMPDRRPWDQDVMPANAAPIRQRLEPAKTPGQLRSRDRQLATV
jgi:putative phosphoribosyl transferase